MKNLERLCETCKRNERCENKEAWKMYVVQMQKFGLERTAPCQGYKQDETRELKNIILELREENKILTEKVEEYSDRVEELVNKIGAVTSSALKKAVDGNEKDMEFLIRLEQELEAQDIKTGSFTNKGAISLSESAKALKEKGMSSEDMNFGFKHSISDDEEDSEIEEFNEFLKDMEEFFEMIDKLPPHIGIGILAELSKFINLAEIQDEQEKVKEENIEEAMKMLEKLRKIYK